MPRRFAVPVLVAVLLGGCSGDDSGPSDPIALDDGDVAADAPEEPEDGGDPGEPADQGDPVDEVVEATTAGPGTWRIGDAGAVTFSVVGDRLVLDDVAPAQGWTVAEVSADGDGIEVELERDGQTSTFEVELKDDASRLEVDTEHDLELAGPGTFDIGAAGSVAVSIAGDRLVVDDLAIADGWEVTERKESRRKLELEVRRDEERWQVKLELDDDRLDVERDHRVRVDL
ncbi:hypothetical protein [Nitriliruptor alkaliphilus]|uniref:hypothetical protein n=1 Tax=Nitriliruptor alkaliphilus TaxID=427918 RepID=UPI0006973A07|nr:hypothetical protein [Nitriliruptor alkaliphilus]